MLNKLLEKLSEQQLKHYLYTQYQYDESFHQSLQLFIKTEELKQREHSNTSFTEIDISHIHSYVSREQNIPEILSQVDVLLAQNDANNALRFLNELLDIYVDKWYEGVEENYYDDVYDDYFSDIAPLVTKALLLSQISNDDKAIWQSNLECWDDTISEYNNTFFESAILAAKEGWNYPYLKEVMQGDFQYSLFDADYNELEIQEFISAILSILKQQQRYQEFLCLSLNENQSLDYVLMLIQLDHDNKALAYCIEHTLNYDDYFSIAQRWNSKEKTAPIFSLLNHIVSLIKKNKDNDNYLSQDALQWGCKLAREYNQQDLLVNISNITCIKYPSIENYKQLKQDTRDQWQEINSSLLATFTQQKGHSVNGIVDIFLFIDHNQEAIDLIKQQRYFSVSPHDLIIQRTITIDPDWVLNRANHEATPIIKDGKAKYYEKAVEWLVIIMKCYLQKENTTEWEQYTTRIQKEHGRKYKLMGLMKKHNLL
jgi:hypothetical protein